MRAVFDCPHCKHALECDFDKISPGAQICCSECEAHVTVPQRKLGPGFILGGFAIRRVLGHGGMGEVYLATQMSMERDVALKILPAQFAFNEDLVKRFRQEVRMVARLDHANIVPAFEAGEDSGIHYLAMAYVDGFTVDQMLRQNGAMPEQEALRIIYKMADALEGAWERFHLVHRDIKPGNIMLDKQGKVRLMDLGLAKSIDDPGNLTRSAMAIGTPNYMSPEQARGERDLDFRSDIYELGTTLYHMLTGRVPFEATTPVGTLQKQLAEKLPDPRKINPNISSKTVKLMARMLAKDREQRYGSYAKLKREIDRVLRGQSSSRPSYSKTGRLLQRRLAQNQYLKKAESTPMPFLLATSAALALLIVIGVAMLFLLDGDYDSGQARSVKERNDEKISQITHDPAVSALSEAAKPRGKTGAEEPEKPAENTSPKASDQVPVENEPETSTAEAEAEAEPVDADELTEVSEQPPVETPSTDGNTEQNAMADRAQGPWYIFWNEIGPDTKTNDTSQHAHDDAVANEKRQELLNEIADTLLSHKFMEIPAVLKKADESNVMADMGEQWETMKTAAQKVSQMPHVVMAAYKKLKDRETPVMLRSGNANIVVKDVYGLRVEAHWKKTLKGGGEVLFSKNFTYSELKPEEKLRRLGTVTSSVNYMMRGLLAAEAGAHKYMFDAFERADCPLGNLLAARAQQLKTQKTATAEERNKAAFEAAAGQALAYLLQNVGIRPDFSDSDRLVDVIRKKEFSKLQVERVKNQLARFENQFSESTIAVENERHLNVLSLIRPGMPLYVDKAAVAKVVERLNALNPRCGVTMDRFSITDEGVEANLERFNNLADISPLSALPIVSINLIGTQVNDVSPLANAPLRAFRYSYMWGTPHSLSQLRLSVLKQCPIKTFFYEGANVDDIDWMEGFDFTSVHIRAPSQMRIQSLAPLRNSHLTTLILQAHGGHGRIADLSVLKNMPLTHLSIDGPSSVQDLSPLRGAPLERLVLPRSKIKSLDPLKGMPLNHLDISGTDVSDLSPLKGMPLKHLNIAGTKVKDISPLIDCPLESLDIRNTSIENISLLGKISTLRKIDR